MKLSVNDPCPCGSTIKYKKCCGVFHKGRPAPPARLMPARYCAYAMGKVRFVIETTHPDGPLHRDDTAAWRAELTEYCKRTRFVGLEVHEVEPENDRGEVFVTFTARLEHNGAASELRERSRFRRDGTRWKYVDGDVRES